MTRPVVLLHGFTGSPASWSGIAAQLSEQHAESVPPADSAPAPILAPAALGHDGTPGPPGIETFEDEVDRLAALAREQGFDRAHLAGYSMGGRLALGLLVRNPELFASATLIGASPGLPDPAERRARTERDEGWARLLETEGLDTFVAAWEALPLFATQDRLSQDVVRRQRDIRRSHDPAGLARSLRVIGLGRMPDYRPRLPDIRCSVRLVTGERDAKFRAIAEEMAERLPAARPTVVPGAGHNVLLERPKEIAALLREDIE